MNNDYCNKFWNILGEFYLHERRLSNNYYAKFASRGSFTYITGKMGSPSKGIDRKQARY